MVTEYKMDSSIESSPKRTLFSLKAIVNSPLGREEAD